MLGGCATTKSQHQSERKILQGVSAQIKALEGHMGENQKKTQEQLDRLWVGLNDSRQRQQGQEERIVSLESKEASQPLSLRGSEPKPLMPTSAPLVSSKKPPSIPPVPLGLHLPLDDQAHEKSPSAEAVQKALQLFESIEDPALKLFLRAQKAYIEKDYPRARALAQELLSRHPDAEVADDSQFLLAESFLAQGLFANAVYEYDAVVTRYPKGNKAPEALLKEAECYERLNLKEDTLKVLGRLIRSYPEAPQSVQARERIARLTSPSP
jgi:tol-pal system protein YbgF